MKKQLKQMTVFLFAILLIITVNMYSKTVSITQLGFIIKKAMPEVKTIAVLYPYQYKSRLIKDAKVAYTILRKKILIYDVSRQFEITKKIDRILGYKNVAVVVITDKNMFVPKTIRFIARKFVKKGIPVFSNREKDTHFDAVMNMFYNSQKKLELHLNMAQLKKLNLSFSDEIVKKCIVDIE